MTKAQRNYALKKGERALRERDFPIPPTDFVKLNWLAHHGCDRSLLELRKLLVRGGGK